MWSSGTWVVVGASAGVEDEGVVGVGLDEAGLEERAEWQIDQVQIVQPSYLVTLRDGAWQGPDHMSGRTTPSASSSTRPSTTTLDAPTPPPVATPDHQRSQRGRKHPPGSVHLELGKLAIAPEDPR